MNCAVLTKNKVYIFFTVYALLLMFLCTKSSPLYVFNDWDDANAYFTVGKSIMNGVVPYKELFEHKGPYLYVFYGIGYLIHNTGFYGIFALQCLSMFLLLIFCYKISLCYTENKASAIAASLMVPLLILQRGVYSTQIGLGG